MASWSEATKIAAGRVDQVRISAAASYPPRRLYLVRMIGPGCSSRERNASARKNRARAFVVAEAILSKYPDWTQDAESMLAMLGPSGIAECQRIEREVAA